MTNDLDKPRNDFVRALANYDKTTALTYLAILLIILSCVSLFVALIAISDAKDAKIRVEYQDRQLEQQDTELRIYRNRAGRLDAYLKAKGVPIEEIYDETVAD